MKKLFIVMGSHLFDIDVLPISQSTPIVMIEDYELCTRFKYHKHKLILFLESMRNYRDLLIENGYEVTYLELNKKTVKESFFSKLAKVCIKDNIDCIESYEIEDHFFSKKIATYIESSKLNYHVYKTPLFLNSRIEILTKLRSLKKPFLKIFYEKERRKTKILMKDGTPIGGKYSFDHLNRKKLPKNISIPTIPKVTKSSNHKNICILVNDLFSDHPGNTSNFWLPTTHKESNDWLDDFLNHRLGLFGDYEDAISIQHPFIFHSVLSPLLNCGLLMPEKVIEKALSKKNISINSLEGFIRQIMGWREFIRGIDLIYIEDKISMNFFSHKRKLKLSWWRGKTGLTPLDLSIKKALEFGYCHHIERLMIQSNTMLLCEIHPSEVYKWFMELFVDSADWVMKPNVFGMGQFGDGGLFATKPYICGSNYLKKMGAIISETDQYILDGLYWRFINKHRDFFSKQPRLNMMVSMLDKMDNNKKNHIFNYAEQFITNNTTEL